MEWPTPMCCRRSLSRITIALLVLAGLCGVAGAASTDRNTLYGLTQDGILYSISTTTGAGTEVRRLPFTPGVSDPFKNLAVYKGTFLTETNSGLTAFGVQTNDQIRMGLVSQSSHMTALTEYPASGLPRGWRGGILPGGLTYAYIREINPVTRIESDLSSLGTVIPLTYYNSDYGTCSNEPTMSSFFSNTKAYFTHTCYKTNPNLNASASISLLLRAELQNGSWVKTLDTGVVGLGVFVADPSTDGILYTAGGFPVGWALTKVNVNTTPNTVTSYQPTPIVSNINGPLFVGLAFGPPVSDVRSPKDVLELKPFVQSGWEPIKMLLDQQ